MKAEEKETINIALGIIAGLCFFCFTISLEFNFIQCVQINELKGKEKVYRMQINHYNPDDYTLKIKETY